MLYLENLSIGHGDQRKAQEHEHEAILPFLNKQVRHDLIES